ncbi:MAG TPA: hypothetical protein VJ969_05245 [Desulfopila sp.]|nr:hypothetical protein [Desulfopila sp.]
MIVCEQNSVSFAVSLHESPLTDVNTNKPIHHFHYEMPVFEFTRYTVFIPLYLLANHVEKALAK